MPAIEHSPAQRKVHRAEAHHLQPVVAVGVEGLTAAVRQEADAALKAHGLIKVRVFSDDRLARNAVFSELAETLGAAPVQHIGKLLVLWRPIPPKESDSGEARGGGSRVVKILKFSKSGNHRPQVKKLTVHGNQRVTAGGMIKRAKKRLTSLKKNAGQT